MAALFFPQELLTPFEGSKNIWIEGLHVPDSLIVQSGIWVQGAGSGVLEPENYPFLPSKCWRIIVLEQGKLSLHVPQQIEAVELLAGDFTIIPPVTHQQRVEVKVLKDTRILCLALDGTLAPMFLNRLGLFLNKIIKQVALPSQAYLMNQIVQVTVRHSGTGNASYHLQQLLWGLLASHTGQPVALNGMLSYEISKVIDTLRAGEYRDNLSLNEMAAIAKMPVETFRKRFSAEIGMPPLSYLLFCKMEKAKELLRLHGSIKHAGQAVGITDPYHFSKQFKSIVGVSPSVYIKYAQSENE